MDDDFEDVFEEGDTDPKLPAVRAGLPATIPGARTKDGHKQESAYWGDEDMPPGFDAWEDEAKQAYRQERNDEQARIREWVSVGIAAGHLPSDMNEEVIDPLTAKPMTLKRFNAVFEKEIRTGGKIAHINMAQSLYGIGAKGKGGKGAGAQVKAIALWLQALQNETWIIERKVKITDETSEETRRKAEEALSEANKWMDEMANINRARPDKEPA